MNRRNPLRLVLCQSADGWSIHAPGSSDEAIATGYAPPIRTGAGVPRAWDWIQATKAHLGAQITVSAALRKATADVGPLHITSSTAKGRNAQYGFNTWDDKREVWMAAGSQPYRLARELRTVAIVARALVLLGHEFVDAQGLASDATGAARDRLAEIAGRGR